MPYKHKHHESYFTRFFETYWLPKKFGYDKKGAFSSLILTGQMSREEALNRIAQPELMPKPWSMTKILFVTNWE